MEQGRSIGDRLQLTTEESSQRDAIMGEKASRMPGSHCRRFMVSNNVEVEVNAK